MQRHAGEVVEGGSGRGESLVAIEVTSSPVAYYQWIFHSSGHRDAGRGRL